MLKEIHEQPTVAGELLHLLDASPHVDQMVARMREAHHLYLIGCGTSYHACLLGAVYLARLAGRPAIPILAPQFIPQYGPTVGPEDVGVFVSQSGETKDVLNALDVARQRGMRALGLVNVIGSTLMNESERYLPLACGYEISVPATKTFMNQGIAFLYLALRMGGHPTSGLADLPGLWAASGSHEGYKQSIGAVVRRLLVVVKDGPLFILDRVSGGDGRRAQWNFHTPLAVKVNADYSVTLSGHKTYRLMLADGAQLPAVKTRLHWAAVLPRDCQPDDCGAQTTALTWEKRMDDAGAEFAAALFEEDGTVRRETGAYRLVQGEREYVVLPGGEQHTVEGGGVRARARLTVLEKRAGKPVRAWVVAGTRLTVAGREC
jgi:D-arabinose 5-phosphate isomerase GutQ